MKPINVVLVLCITYSSSVLAEDRELATDIVNNSAPIIVPEAPLEERITRFSSIIPGELNRDNAADMIDRLIIEKEYIDALLERNQSLESLNELHNEPQLSLGSTDINERSLTSESQHQATFRGNGDFLSGDMTTASIGQQRQMSSQSGEPRFAALDYTWSLGGDRVARVQWGESYPTVKLGDVLPGGFVVEDITADELIIEKEGVVVRMNQDRVSIDALMRAISDQRAKASE